MKYLLALILMVTPLFWWTEVSAEDLYVSKVGSGTKNGSDINNAWDTWAKVQWGTGALKVGSGDTLYVVDKLTENCVIGASGTVGNPITIRGDSSGVGGSIDGTGVAGTTALLYGTSKSYIVVSNITIVNSTARSVQFQYGNTRSIHLSGLTIGNSQQFPVLVSGATDVILTDSYIYDASMAGSNAGEAVRFGDVGDIGVINGEIARVTINGGKNSGIDLFGSTNGILVHHNTVHGLTGATSGNAFYIDASDSVNTNQRNYIYNNIAYDLPYGSCFEVGAENKGLATGNYVFNNICYDAKGGFTTGSNYTTDELIVSSDNYVFNNTFFSNSSFNSLYILDGAKNIKTRNNIFYESQVGGTAIKVVYPGSLGLDMDYDIIRRYDGVNQVGSYEVTSGNTVYPSISTFCSTYGQECHGKNVDPTLKVDYSLYQSSPAINAGVWLPEVTDDYNGNPRIGADIGAITYGRTNYKGLTISGTGTVK